MKIGIIGAGNVGTGLGRRLADHGHDIVVSFARTDEKVAAAARSIGRGARGGTTEQAARHGDVVIVATPWAVTLETTRPLKDALAGRIVWDTTNPFAPDLSTLVIGTITSAGEELAKVVGTTVVKAIPPFAEVLHSDSMRIDGRAPGVFVCSDDATARERIVSLVAQVGCDAVDAGPLRMARLTEPFGLLLTNLAYVQGFGARIGGVLVRESSPRVHGPA